jgi:hypothetical protein
MAKNTTDPKIRKFYKPTDKEEELISHVYTRYYEMKDNDDRQKAEKEWDAGEKAWDQYEKESENLEEWQAKYYVPLTTSVVESTLSEMIDQSPRPIILPRSSEDIPRATVMRHTFDYTWEVGDGDENLEHVLKDSLIYGDGFAQEYYWKDRRVIKTLSDVNKNEKGKKSFTYSEREAFEYDDCYMESISPYEVFFDERARSINRGPYKARDAIRRYILKLDDAKQFFSGDTWDPMGNMRYVRCGGDTNWYSFFKPPTDVNHKDEVEILWYWSRIPEDWLIITINDVLIKAGPNPYKHKMLPFAKTSDVLRPHKFFNKGEPKLLESIQKELNTLRRMITDRNHLDIDKMWLVSRSETYSEEDTLTRPHGIIRVDDPSNYKPVEYNDIPQSVSFTIDELNKDSVRVTGVEERFQAVKTPGTATEAAIVKEAVLRRIRAKLRRLEKGFLVDVGRMRVANIMQFYSQPKLEKIVGDAGSFEYRKKVDDARRKGLLQTIKNKPYVEKYKTIRIKDKELGFDNSGQVIEKPFKGYTFFDLKPEYFMPVAQGGFDIRFEAGSTMPVSKPLLAKQAQDVSALLMPLATSGIGYDPIKLGDWILETLDKDPTELHTETPATEQVGKAQNEQLLELAEAENREVASGAEIPEMGTPYASPDHTMVHINFLRSSTGTSLDEQTYQKLVKHIMGEITAQNMRGDVASLPGQPTAEIQMSSVAQTAQPQSSASPQYNEELKATMPNKIQGGEELEGTQKGSMMNRIFNVFNRGK